MAAAPGRADGDSTARARARADLGGGGGALSAARRGSRFREGRQLSQDLIIGYDDSPGARAALEVAIALACDLNERLVIVFGYERPEDVDEELEVARRALLELGEGVARHALERAGAAGCEAELAVLGARPVDALLQVATERNARLIVVGSYGDSPLKGAILGSTPHKLLHMADRPVLAVPAPEISAQGE